MFIMYTYFKMVMQMKFKKIKLLNPKIFFQKPSYYEFILTFIKIKIFQTYNWIRQLSNAIPSYYLKE